MGAAAVPGAAATQCWLRPLARVLLFPALLLYLELVLHIYMKAALVYVPMYLVFSLAGGLFLSALALPWRRLVNSIVAKVLAVFLSVIFGVEIIAKTILQTYYGPAHWGWRRAISSPTTPLSLSPQC